LEVYELNPESQIGGWQHQEADVEEEDDLLYSWTHRDEPDRFQVQVRENEEDYQMNYTDFNEIVYCLIGCTSFETEEAAFRYALDFMEQFEIENR